MRLEIFLLFLFVVSPIVGDDRDRLYFLLFFYIFFFFFFCFFIFLFFVSRIFYFLFFLTSKLGLQIFYKATNGPSWKTNLNWVCYVTQRTYKKTTHNDK